jgi:hypothetical protein
VLLVVLPQVTNARFHAAGRWQSELGCPTSTGQEPRNNTAFACQPQRVIAILEARVVDRIIRQICASSSQVARSSCTRDVVVE